VAEPEVRIRRFLQKMPLSFPVLLDRDRRMAKAWKAASLPTTFVLDRKGHGLFIEESFKWDRLDLVSLRRMLAQSEKRKSASAISSDVK
ncbi:MAG TPA: TlpA disulfide reductase family protein, partial [Hyphomicrobiales bacterium]|nr:TlpA disulfide reductase family protein [Hyphomicrobiales bacterium]